MRMNEMSNREEVGVQKKEDELVQELCADSFVPFTSAVRKMDEVCHDMRLIQEQIAELKETIESRLERRASAKKREAAARAAAEASRAAADRLMNQR
mmetsp:Transcript_19203/g.24921  ORF Transcript_19203/g.24921 Transcript_19203/m.24921 type:complete len:97 (-) Transcript_19203:438-728(-)